MQLVSDMSGAQRGRRWAAKFHETQREDADFPPLAPLVRALAALRTGPGLPGR